MYSLGCVFLEILFAIVYGTAALDQKELFSDNMKTLNDRIAHQVHEPREVDSEAGPSRFRLIARLTALMTSEDPGTRPTSSNLASDITSSESFCCSKCQERHDLHKGKTVPTAHGDEVEHTFSKFVDEKEAVSALSSTETNVEAEKATDGEYTSGYPHPRTPTEETQVVSPCSEPTPFVAGLRREKRKSTKNLIALTTPTISKLASTSNISSNIVVPQITITDSNHSQTNKPQLLSNYDSKGSAQQIYYPSVNEGCYAAPLADYLTSQNHAYCAAAATGSYTGNLAAYTSVPRTYGLPLSMTPSFGGIHGADHGPLESAGTNTSLVTGLYGLAISQPNKSSEYQHDPYQLPYDSSLVESTHTVLTTPDTQLRYDEPFGAGTTSRSCGDQKFASIPKYMHEPVESYWSVSYSSSSHELPDSATTDCTSSSSNSVLTSSSIHPDNIASACTEPVKCITTLSSQDGQASHINALQHDQSEWRDQYLQWLEKSSDITGKLMLLLAKIKA
jgi:hypothetical protein